MHLVKPYELMKSRRIVLTAVQSGEMLSTYADSDNCMQTAEHVANAFRMCRVYKVDVSVSRITPSEDGERTDELAAFLWDSGTNAPRFDVERFTQTL